MDTNFFDILNNGLDTINTGATDYLNFVKTQQLNNVLTNPNVPAGQIYTTGSAINQTGAVGAKINSSFLIIGGVFLIILLLIVVG